MPGPAIPLADTNTLFKFAKQCHTAKLFYESDPNILQSINERPTQQMIFNRLEPTLKERWLRERRKYVDSRGNSPFGALADWIQSEAQLRIEFPLQDKRSDINSPQPTN